MGAIAPVHFKGTNYLASSALSIANPLGLLSPLPSTAQIPVPYGTYWPPYVEQEIEQIAAAGLNNIRLFGSLFGWIIDPDNYLQSLEHLCRVCCRHGIVVTYVIWNSTATLLAARFQDAILQLQNSRHAYQVILAVTRLSQTLTTTPLPHWEPGHFVLFASPGPAITAAWSQLPANNNIKQLLLSYVTAVGEFFAKGAGKEAFGSYDLYNEPDAYRPPLNALTLDIIRDTHKTLAGVHTNAEYTVGMAGPDDTKTLTMFVKALKGLQTYISYHCDERRFKRGVVTNVRRVLSSQSVVVPQVVSEFWHTYPGKDNQTGRMRELITKYIVPNGLGGQMWGFLETNTFVMIPPTRVDGILRPILPKSGRLRDPLSFSVSHPADLDAVHLWTTRYPTATKPVPTAR